MAAPQGPTALNTSGIVDGTTIDAIDVTVPFGQVETAIDQARTTVKTKETDTVLQYLEDAIAAGAGITITPSTVAGATTLSLASAGISTGIALPYYGAGDNIPAGFLLLDGSEANNTTYEDLLDVLIDATDYYSTNIAAAFGTSGLTQFTFTADAGTDKILAAGHGLSNGDIIHLVNSGGALPSGTAINVKYFVIESATNDFKISLTLGGSAVDIIDAGSGTHYALEGFLLPDMRGRVFGGLDAMITGSSANVVTDAAADAIGGNFGAETHQLTEAELASHDHTYDTGSSSTPSTINYSRGSSFVAALSTNNAGGDTPHNNVQPTQFGNWIIKT